MKDLKITKGEVTDEGRKQLLKDTLLYFAPSDRYITDEKGIRYYREDVTLKAMELSEQPPSELLKQRDELLEALKELVHLHMCEQEGLLSGQPTPEQWLKAVEKAEMVINKAEEKDENNTYISKGL